MELSTLQQLGTLEILLGRDHKTLLPNHRYSGKLYPYYWDSKLAGSFSLWKLIRCESWLTETDPEITFSDWQWPENYGLAAVGLLNCGHLCEEDSENIFLSNNDKIDRQKRYKILLQTLSNNLQDFKAYRLQCHPDYSLSIIVGRLPDQRWICLAPLVPRETSDFANSEIEYTLLGTPELPQEIRSELELDVNEQIDQIPTIQVYGWYYGGYNHVHPYRIINATGNTQEVAIERALFTAGFIGVYQFQQFHSEKQFYGYSNWKSESSGKQFQILNLFLKQSFSNLYLYRFCFWDYDNVFILDSQQSPDKVGIVFQNQFEYNP